MHPHGFETYLAPRSNLGLSTKNGLVFDDPDSAIHTDRHIPEL